MKTWESSKRTNGTRARKHQRNRFGNKRRMLLESLEQRHLLTTAPLTIGDFVWHDLNANGIQDVGEPGIPDAAVHLLDGITGNTISSTTTDADGLYSFTNLQPNVAYKVSFDLPFGFNEFSPRKAGPDTAKDSDAPTSDAVTLPQIGLTIDAFNGVSQIISFSGQTAPPTLSGTSTAVDQTAIGGERELVYTVTSKTLSDTSARLQVTPNFTLDQGSLVTGQARVTWDGVGSGVAAEGLNVDLTRNGLDNLFFFNVVFVDLTTKVKLTVTDNVGETSSLERTGLGAGLVQFPFADFTGNADFTTVKSIVMDVGGPAAVDLILSGLTTGRVAQNFDAGAFKYASLGDFVWLDVIENGIQDQDEPGVAGVTVNLLDGDGNPVLDGSGAAITTITNAVGFYEFTGLRPGDYMVEFVLPIGYEFTQQVGELDDANNSDAVPLTDDPLTGRTVPFALASGEHNPRIDAGLIGGVGGGGGEEVAAIELRKLVGVAVTEDPGELEGLTPGFWRTHSRFGPAPLSGWPETGYDPLDSYEAIFGVDVPGEPTLLDAVWADGGGVNALMRHSAAALLNAAHPNINYEFSQAEVIAWTQTAILSGNSVLIESTKDLFDAANNRGADLTSGGSSNGGTTTVTFEDADDPTGPVAQVGDTVWFQIFVTNTGDVSLDNIEIIDEISQIVDDNEVLLTSFWIGDAEFVGGDTNKNDLLDVGETWEYRYSIIADATGQFVNLAVVFATPVDGVVGDDDVSALDEAYWEVQGEGDPGIDDPGDDDPGIDDPVDDQPTGTQGLTPGFWRQNHHFAYWPTGYAPTGSYSDIFGVSAGNTTLLQALTAGGGGVSALLRQSAAALLNAAHPDIDYAFTPEQVIAMVQDAFRTGDYETTKNVFDVENNRGNVDLKSGSGSGGDSAASGGHHEYFGDLEDDEFHPAIDDDLAKDVAGKGKGNSGKGRGKK
jgi:hypothetical protein